MPTAESEHRQSAGLARHSCLALGVGLLVWGLAPLLVEYAVTRQGPPWRFVVIALPTLLIGLTFVALSLLIGQNRRWALHAAVLVSAAILAWTAGQCIASEAHPARWVFPILVATPTALMSWMALTSGSAGSPSSPPSRRDAKR